MPSTASPDLPTPENYANALRKLRGTPVFGKPVELMLKHHYQCIDRTATYGELAKAAGYDNYKSAYTQYGKFSRELGNMLGFAFQPSGKRDGQELFYGSVIGDGAGSGEHFKLRMYPALVDALDMLGWFQTDVLETLRPTTKNAWLHGAYMPRFRRALTTR